MNSSPPLFPLRVDYSSNDVIRAEDTRINIVIVVPAGSDSLRINGDNAVDDFVVGPWWDKNDYISRSDYPAIVRNDVKTISALEGRVHAGTDIIN